MFDIAWSHILLIGVVALLVIGPKDLPKVLRTVGVWVGRARSIAREFQGSLDQMIREAELEEVRKEVEQATTVDLDHTIESSADPGGEMKQAFEPPAPEPTVPAPDILPEPEPEAPPAAAAEPQAPEPQTAEAPAAEAPAVPKSGTHD